jgi:carboxymethylenebutenolidase
LETLSNISGSNISGSSPDEPRSYALVQEPRTVTVETAEGEAQIRIVTVDIISEGKNYPAYTAAPVEEGKYPAVVLLHSFNGFVPGYREMVDRMAADGFVVVAPQWQTYSISPTDAEVESVVRDSTEYLQSRDYVDPERLGLTGFCAGGRYTMLYLPKIKELSSGVAWYGFPYTSGSMSRPEKPADLIESLEAPMLVIHGSRDLASDISNIYKYAGELDTADKYFELKVYQGEPHGFMIDDSGSMSESSVAQDAYREMIEFFERTL